MKIIIANWKMNPQKQQEASLLGSRIEQGLLGVNRRNVETVICPPFVFLGAVKVALHFAKLGAQNVSRESGGAFTGDISAKQLKEFGAEYVIIGHSETRRLGCADDEIVNRKIEQALSQDLKPILCVGYGTKNTHNDVAIKNIVRRQIAKGLAGIKASKIVIAYEPVWAISRGLGTGKAATPQHAASVISYIKKQVPKARVIYGGSVNAKNAAAFAELKIIDGGLVGGASLVASEFLSLSLIHI